MAPPLTAPDRADADCARGTGHDPAPTRRWRLPSARHQLAVHSPVTLSALLRALPDALGTDEEAQAALSEELRLRYRADQVLLYGSGTQALQLALRLAIRYARSDAGVALPAFCCYDVASAAIGAELPVLLYDLDPETLTPDLNSLERAFRSGVRVAVIAPLYGMPAPWEELDRLAREHGAVLIEDAAQGHGASWRGIPLGALGEISVLSFGRGKGWTGGGGGALLLRGDFAREVVLPELPHGPAGTRTLLATGAQWLLGRPSLYGLPMSIPALGLGETRYRYPTKPHRIPSGAAALLLSLRQASDQEAEHRRRRAAEVLKALEPVPHAAAIRSTFQAHPGFLRLPVRCLPGRASIMSSLSRRLGVAASYPGTLGELRPLQVHLRQSGRTFPGASQLVRQLITLPTHSLMDRAELPDLLSCLRHDSKA